MSAYRPTYAPYPVAPNVRPRSMNDRVEDTRAAPWSRSAQKVSPLCFARSRVMRLMARSGSSVPIGQLASLVWHLDVQQTDHRAHAPHTYLVRSPWTSQGPPRCNRLSRLPPRLSKFEPVPSTYGAGRRRNALPDA